MICWTEEKPEGEPGNFELLGIMSEKFFRPQGAKWPKISIRIAREDIHIISEEGLKIFVNIKIDAKSSWRGRALPAGLRPELRKML